MKRNLSSLFLSTLTSATASFALLSSISPLANAVTLNTQSNQVENKQLVAQSCGNTEIRLTDGQSKSWGRGSSWKTCNGYTFGLQNDGNLVLYSRSAWLWSTNTAGRGHAIALQRDGNVVLYDSNWKPIWATNTVGNSGAFLALQTDGNLVVYNNSGRPLWATNTVQPATNPNTVATPLSSSYMKKISQDFGNKSSRGFHTGYDIDTANNNPSVYAIADGTVVWNSTSSTKYATAFDKYWNAFVIIKHSNYYAYYGHLTSSLSEGSTVRKGYSIGSIRDAYSWDKSKKTADKSVLYRDNNHLHISISTGKNWVQGGWGYQPKEGLNQFVNPAKYIGL